MRTRAISLFAALLPLLWLVCGCHSYQIDTTVVNRTGDAITLLEVNYPSASFGVDKLASGAHYNYRFKVRDSGPVKVQYTESRTEQMRQMTGPELAEGQEGRLEIVLLPGGKVEFLPELSPKR